MGRFRPPQRRSGGRQLRPMDWTCAQMDVELAPDLKACAWLIDPIDVLETFTDPTLMATRQFSNIRSLSSTGATGTFAAIGVIAWDGIDELPPADCPGPLSDCDFDWIVRIVSPIPASAPSANGNPNIFDNTHLSKARRRLPSQTGILVAFETEGVTASFAIDIRCLIKE